MRKVLDAIDAVLVSIHSRLFSREKLVDEQVDFLRGEVSIHSRLFSREKLRLSNHRPPKRILRVLRETCPVGVIASW